MHWHIAPTQPITAAQQTAAQQSPLLAQLLLQRGITTPEAMATFLDPMATPPISGLALPTMDVAVQRLVRAIDEQEPILIYGDFDVDGITGTAVLLETLRHLQAKVSFYTPDRAKEGHGLHAASLVRLISIRQVKVVVSTDTGITNVNEVCLLNNLGVSSIITDHHELADVLPPGVANVNPRLLHDESHPLAPMAGVGVAFKLCELLLAHYQADPVVTERLLDLVAIGTIADVAPLTMENRRLVTHGLQVLNQRNRLGLNAVLAQATVAEDAPLNAETVGFTIGPRLNAIGRLADANEAVTLLTTTDAEEAHRLASQLEALNRRRREVCEKTALEAEQFIRQSGMSIGPHADQTRAIVLASPDWHLGVIGIVASRLVEAYRVPVFLMVHDTQANTLRCSARSIKGFSITEALEPLRHYFTVFGGHAMAGGFTLSFDRFNAFKQDLYAVAAKLVTPEMMQPELNIDATLTHEQLTEGLVAQLQALEPCGQGNRAPVLGVLDATVVSAKLLNEQHLKLVISNGYGTTPIDALMWRVKDRSLPQAGDKVDVAGSVGLNTFNQKTRVQLVLNDFRLTPANAAQQDGITGGLLPALPQIQPKPQLPVATVAPARTEQAIMPAVAETNGVVWVDHRHRHALDQFVGLLLKEALPDGGQRLVFHEGREPQLPYSQPAHFINRQSAKPATELIFWDFPPDMATLQTVLHGVQPRVIHWVGGKYMTVPVRPDVLAYQKVLFGVCNRLPAQSPVAIAELACTLATSAGAVLTGLAALKRMGVIAATMPTPGFVSIAVLPKQVDQMSLENLPLEQNSWQQALTTVADWRHVCLTAGGAVWQPLLAALMQTPVGEGFTPATAQDTSPPHINQDLLTPSGAAA
jgi:single-stranded-DNA-specific exonuclease